VRKRRSFQIGPATPGEVSGTKKRDIFLEKNPVKTVENYSFDRLSRNLVPVPFLSLRKDIPWHTFASVNFQENYA
jgi:hypothetical protein